ncbi:MAG: GTPase ObgE [Candidatus Sungbacteria bacterium]|nr:GTPase ObgE [Candidatus Sungbacteria bacterium]
MFIDDITIKLRAGSGGRGAVLFNKNLNQYGPVGGSGGDGGDIYFEGSSDFSILSSYRFKKEFSAKNGGDGKGQFRDGPNAKDLVLYVPVGTIIHNLTANPVRTDASRPANESIISPSAISAVTADPLRHSFSEASRSRQRSNGVKNDREIVSIGERFLAARGGRGGRGNFHFRSSVNTRPKEFEYGAPGENFTVRLELKLIADVGLIGLPNVGKSSLLNEFTNARSKVGNFLFTTLEPNLGVYYELVLADIPGLIEGASGGRGLGIKFLRHIERTKVLFHIISAESADPYKDYKIVRKELGIYSKALLDKKEFIFLGKSDTVSRSELKKKLSLLKKKKMLVGAFSIYDYDAIEKTKSLNKLCGLSLR